MRLTIAWLPVLDTAIGRRLKLASHYGPRGQSQRTAISPAVCYAVCSTVSLSNSSEKYTAAELEKLGKEITPDNQVVCPRCGREGGIGAGGLKGFDFMHVGSCDCAKYVAKYKPNSTNTPSANEFMSFFLKKPTCANPIPSRATSPPLITPEHSSIHIEDEANARASRIIAAAFTSRCCFGTCTRSYPYVDHGSSDFTTGTVSNRPSVRHASRSTSWRTPVLFVHSSPRTMNREIVTYRIWNAKVQTRNRLTASREVLFILRGTVSWPLASVSGCTRFPG